MRTNGEDLNFITEKVKQIKIALFRSDINSELLLPNNIIRVLQTDNEGNIWFLTSCINMQAKNIDKQFYAYLDFYEKQTGCRLQLNGLAFLTEDENDFFINRSNYSKSVLDSLVLVKMKIQKAEFYEGVLAQNISWKDKLSNTFNSLFISRTHKVYTFG